MQGTGPLCSQGSSFLGVDNTEKQRHHYMMSDHHQADMTAFK